MRSLILALVVAVVACSQGTGRPDGPDGAGGGGGGDGGGGGGGVDDDSACAPDRVGMAQAQRVRTWSVPEGCTRSAGGDVTIHSEEELRARYTCPAGVTFGIDFTRDQLVLVDGMLSPAEVGTDLYDDGTKITFVHRQRTPCNTGMHPMPAPVTLGYLLPAGAQRTTAEAACTIRAACR